MEEKEKLKKKIFREYFYIVLAIMFTYFVTLKPALNFSTVILMPIFLIISFIINPIIILILHNSKIRTISSRIKRIFYYVITIFPILVVIFIISFVLISDYMYGK